MLKPFITIDQQIDLLKTKGLIISDEKTAFTVLSDTGYFPLISGYKNLFKNKTTKRYRDNATFGDILSLYRFDEGLRHIFLRYLLIIERSIKAQLSYEFCVEHGDQPSAYKYKANYNCSNEKEVNILIGKLTKIADKDSDYSYINYQRTKYNSVPLWVLINALTFGTVAKMFGVLHQRVQSRICRKYPLYPSQMNRILSVLTKYRNVCAHGERLFSYTTMKEDIPDLLMHKKLGIPKKNEQYACGKHDLFAVVIALRYLLNSEDFYTFKSDMSKIIVGFSKQCNAISESELLGHMGFPQNWKCITRYKVE
jgi:abortive infection bacteriophage resistance protein